MNNHQFFRLLKEDQNTAARIGVLETSHGTTYTPAFMPVGTQATVKALTPEELKQIGSSLILCNTYHLFLRPGVEVIAKCGGLHRFMHWNGSILTDSGGFQVYSLGHLRKIGEEGVLFRSHIDGALHLFSPEASVEAQEQLGSDIMMPLDVCLSFPSTFEEVREAVSRTTRWAKRAQDFHRDKSGYLFGIIQGGTFLKERLRSLSELEELDFPGLAIGGLSVGETKEEMHEVLGSLLPNMPKEKPRYLMGMSAPSSLVKCVALGVDLFDCVLPTRLGRNGTVYTSRGKLNIDNSSFRMDFSPIEPDCDCYVCQNYSRAYLRHLFLAKEMLAGRLMSYHNLRFMERLMEDIRLAIKEGRFLEFQGLFEQTYKEGSINA